MADEITSLKREYTDELWRQGDLAYKLDTPKFAAQLGVYNWWYGQEERISVLHATRGFGKTSLELIIGAEKCLRNRKQRVVFAAPTREQAKSIVIPVSQIVYADAPEDVAPFWQEANHCYYFPSTESRLFVDGADDERGNHLRGPFAHLVFADEAGFWRYCHYVVKSVLLPQVQRVKGRMLVSSTSPESLGHEFVGLIPEAKSRGSYISLTIRDNTMLTREEQDRTIDEMGGEASTTVQREYFCALVTDKNRAVVPEFDESKHVEERERPGKCHKYTFMDLGLIDFAHVLFAYYDFSNAQLVIEDEHCKNYETTEQLSDAIKAKEHANWCTLAPDKHVPHIDEKTKLQNGWDCGERPHRRISDNDVQQLHDLSVTHKVFFEPAKKYDAEAALNRERELFAAGRIKIHPRCVAFIHQLKVGIWNANRTDYERLPGAGHLDGIDALKMGIRGVDFNSNPFDDKRPRGRTNIADDTFYPHVKVSTVHELAKIMPRFGR